MTRRKNDREDSTLAASAQALDEFQGRLVEAEQSRRTYVQEIWLVGWTDSYVPDVVRSGWHPKVDAAVAIQLAESRGWRLVHCNLWQSGTVIFGGYLFHRPAS